MVLDPQKQPHWKEGDSLPLSLSAVWTALGGDTFSRTPWRMCLEGEPLVRKTPRGGKSVSSPGSGIWEGGEGDESPVPRSCPRDIRQGRMEPRPDSWSGGGRVGSKAGPEFSCSVRG